MIEQFKSSYETFYQCVKRSNRYGATRPHLRPVLAVADVRLAGRVSVEGREGRREHGHIHTRGRHRRVIDRLVRLYSNPGEIVFTPFAGIGSEVYTALKLGRRAYGIELKPEYHAAAMKNAVRGIAEGAESVNLFTAEPQ